MQTIWNNAQFADFKKSVIQPHQFTPIHRQTMSMTNKLVEKHQSTTSCPPGIKKTSGMDEDFFKSFS